jgi:molybdopterin/thiamine biosynthesis adenylyltransferase
VADPRFRSLGGSDEDEAQLAARLEQPVRLVIGEGQASWSRQLLAICLADLLGRLLPLIEVACDPEIEADDRLPPGPATLVERIADARAHALIKPRDTPGEEPVLTVVIGEGEGDVYVDGSGWISYLGDHPGDALAAEGANPIGPLVAACRGAAQVIQRLIVDVLPTTTHVESSYWSALTLDECRPGDGTGSPPLDDPHLEALLMGAGSIGGAAAYAFARVPGLTGSLPIVDFDHLEEKNSRKALLARAPEIEAATAKAKVASGELSHLGDLEAEPFEISLAAYVAARPADQPLPLVLSAVDSIAARRELADHMPLEALNAACGDTQISLSGHHTDNGPCIYCLYIGEILDVEATKAKMMQRELGLPEPMIVQLRINKAGLEVQHLRQIERHRELDRGALADYRNKTVDVLFEERILYGETKIEDAEGRRSLLQLAFVPALAGFLLAGEALKAAGGAALIQYRLGPQGVAIEYAESLLEAPVGMRTNPLRWNTSECLCRSQRRLALMCERYGL